MGIIPRGESPWGWAPTIRFGMAADAINVSDTCYMTAERYYLANLGMTMESQVRSSVYPLVAPLFLSILSQSILSTCLSFPAPRCVPRAPPFSFMNDG